MEDLAKSPLVREQKTFEQRLAAAVILHSVEDYMSFEEPTAAKSKQTRHDRKTAKLATESAQRFFDSSSKGGERGSKGLLFWTDILCQGRNPGIKKDWFRHLESKKQRLYDAKSLMRLTGQLANFPPWVAAEAYRRVIEARWLIYYAQHCGGFPTRVMSLNEHEYWKGVYRASLTPADVEQEAKDIMFENKYGLVSEVAA